MITKEFDQNTRGEFGDYRENTTGFKFESDDAAGWPTDERAIWFDGGYWIPAEKTDEVQEWLVWDSNFGWLSV